LIMTNLKEINESFHSKCGKDDINMEWIMTSSVDSFQSIVAAFLMWCDKTINEANPNADPDVLKYLKDAQKTIDGMRMLTSTHEIDDVRNLARVTIKGAYKVAHCLNMEEATNER